jgi:hypothetical protein
MVLGYIGGPLSHAKQAVDLCRAAGEKARHPEKPRVGISTRFFSQPFRSVEDLSCRIAARAVG